jgi:biopolymer transport protein ExbB
MYALIQTYEATRDFLELGGDILVVIAWVTLLMWILILERFIYFSTTFKRQAQAVIERWEARAERTSWNAYQIRQAMISRVELDTIQFLPIIKSLISLCPLLGLLGTVTGMIEVFDAMAAFGSSDARSMAAGVSKATIPTMAGMVAALSGVFCSTWLNRKAARELQLLGETLTTDH